MQEFSWSSQICSLVNFLFFNIFYSESLSWFLKWQVFFPFKKQINDTAWLRGVVIQHEALLFSKSLIQIPSRSVVTKVAQSKLLGEIRKMR